MPVTFECPKGIHGLVEGVHLGNNDFICPGCYKAAIQTYQDTTTPAVQHVQYGLNTIFKDAGLSMSSEAKPNYDVRVRLTEGERRAIGIMVADLAQKCREDIIGAILKTGAFHELEDHDEAVVQLSRKLEAFLPEDHKFRRMVEAKPKVGFRLFCPEGCAWSVQERPEIFPIECPRCYYEVWEDDLGIKVLGAKPCGVCGVLPDGWDDDTNTTYSEDAEMYLCLTCIKEE